jgi:ribosome maturation factor RimP
VSASRAQVENTIAPVVATAGYDLEDLVVTTAGRRRLVKVVVDRDGGVTLDDAADLSRRISAALDDDDRLMGQGAFVLEVTSPGVDRPLTLPRHWRRAQGRLVRAELIDGSATIGRVLGSDDQGATLDVDGGEQLVTYADVAKAIVQVELNRKAADAALGAAVDEESAPDDPTESDD